MSYKSFLKFPRTKILKILLLVNIISVIIVLMYFYTPMSVDLTRRHIHDSILNEEPLNKDSDKQTCIIPKFDPYHKQIARFILNISDLQCSGDVPLLEISEKNILRFKNPKNRVAKNEEVSRCIYWAIERDKDNERPDDKIRYVLRPNSKFVTEASITDDFVKVECYNSKNKSIYEDYKATIVKKSKVEERVKMGLAKNPGPKLNVLFFGLDSVSRLNSIRHLKRTRKFLERDDVLEFVNHNKVEESTLDNMIPVLTGKKRTHFWNESMKSTFDHINLIWHNFSRNGYRTLFAEDAPEMGTFNFEKIGFVNPPVDYYFRPYTSAYEYSNKRKNNRNHCFDNRMEMEIPMEWTERFMNKFSDQNYFVWMFISRITHTLPNDVGYADKPVYEFLKRIIDGSDVMNNTVIIFFSDHGIRYGDIRRTHIGEVEFNAPFIFMRFPKWFKRKYPKIWNNLKINQNRFTSHFDLHYTLKDILNYPQSLSANTDDANRKSPGMSLFWSLPLKRNCDDVGVPPHYCTCYTYKAINVTSKIAEAAAKHIVANVNQMTQENRKKCSIVTIEKIMSAAMKTDRNDPSLKYYSVYVRLNPRSAEFHGTLRYYSKTGTLKLKGELSRINRYYEQSACVHQKTLKEYCICYE